jgi:cold shock protein
MKKLGWMRRCEWYLYLSDSSTRRRFGMGYGAVAWIVLLWISRGVGQLGAKSGFQDEFGALSSGSEGDEAGLDLIEVAGAIKWFDVAKGYGFIVPDDGSADILLHVTTLRRCGYQTAQEGARVVCEAQLRAKGLQVFRIVAMDETTAVHPSQSLAGRTHVQVTPVGGYEIAIVKWFNRIKGFGFLTRGEGTEDIFLHMETVRRYGLAELKPGDSVLVRYGDGPKGLMAAEVRPLDAKGPASH